MPYTAPSLWKNREFNTFWAGQTLSALGDAFSSIAVPLLVLQATGSLHAMGRLTSIVAVANAASCLVSGTVVDRVDRRRLMVACDLGRWAVYTAVPLVWWLRGPSYPLLVAASAVGAVLGTAFQVSAITAVTSLVPRERLIEANGRLMGSYAAMFFVGPMLAGHVCERWGASWAIGVDALTFLASAVSVAAVRGALSGARRDENVGVVAGLLAGVRFLWGVPALRAVVVLHCLSSLLMGGRENLVIFHVKRELHGGESAVGNVFAVASVGSVLAASLAARLRARWGFAACWLGAGAALGAASAGAGMAGSVAAVAPLAAVVAFAETTRGINTMTLRQEVTPDRLLGRVTAAFWALLTVPAALGAEWNARLAERYGVGPVLGLLGAALVALMAAGVASPIRRPVERAALR